MPCPSPPLSLPRLPLPLAPPVLLPPLPQPAPRLSRRDRCPPPPPWPRLLYALRRVFGIGSCTICRSPNVTAMHALAPTYVSLQASRAAPPPLSQQLRLLRHVTPCALCTQAALPVYQHAPSTVHREPPCHPPHTHTPSCLGHCTSPRGRWGPTCAPARCLACQCPSSEQRCSTPPARVVP